MRVLADGRVKRSGAEWRGIVERFEASGLSVSAFCREEKLGRGTFTRWRQQVREEAPGPAEGGEFVELSRLRDAAASSAGSADGPPLAAGELELALPGGVRLRVRL